jgi:hypothetical protein
MCAGAVGSGYGCEGDGRGGSCVRDTIGRKNKRTRGNRGHRSHVRLLHFDCLLLK